MIYYQIELLRSRIFMYEVCQVLDYIPCFC